MERKQPTCDFIDFKLFKSNIDSLKSDFDPTPHNEDSESCSSDIMKISDGLRKKIKKTKKT